jgi:hypothetical protein
MNPMEAASPPLIPLDARRARLRGRPSGLKGRYRDRFATGLRPPLTPEPLRPLTPAAVSGRRRALPAQRAARRHPHPTKIRSLQPSLYGLRGLPETLHAANDGLDYICMRGWGDAAIRLDSDDYLVWWPDCPAVGVIIRARIIYTTRARFTGTMTVGAPPPGSPAPAPAPPTPAQHDAFRFIRMARTSEYLFDAYRNMFLALERLLSERRAAIEAGAQVAAPNSDGANIPDVLLPRAVDLDCESLLAGRPQEVGPNEVIMFKPRWSAFYRTDLDRHLHDRASRLLS